MTPEQLKSSILQQAIEGKLVPQDPAEGTAEELYQQIQSEKEKLIKEKKIKKEKPLPEITEEEIPFEIPESWKWVRLGEIGSIINGDRGKNYPSKAKLSRVGIPFISALNLNNGSVVHDEKLMCVSEEQYEKLRSGKLLKNDIVICIRGSLGKYARVNFEKGAIASSLVIFRLYLLDINIVNYMLRYIDSGLFSSLIKKYDNGTAQPNLAAKSLNEFIVPLPPLSEQKRILAKIEQLLPLVEQYGKAYEKLQAYQQRFPEDLKKSILQEAIQGKLVPQDPAEGNAEDLYQQIQTEKARLIKEKKIKKEKPLPEITEEEIPFEIPETWKWCHIGDIFQHNTGKALNRTDKKGKELTYITTSNLYWNRFMLDDLRSMYFDDDEIKKCTVKKGDLLVCEGGEFGRSAIWEDDEPIRIQNHIHRLRPYQTVDVKYFYYIFYLYKNSGRITGKGIGIQGLSSNRLHSLLVPLPPLAEQKRIVAKIESLLPLVEKLQKGENAHG